MKWLKVVFYQTLMISTAILFGIGVQAAVLHFTTEYDAMSWPWYTPLSIVFTGFLCSLPTCLMLFMEKMKTAALRVCVILHFFLIAGIVTGCGAMFGWFESRGEYIIIMVMYVIIYFAVWISTLWMSKADEKKINAAIKELQDDE